MNKTKVEGVVDQAKGKIKQALGEATGDQKTANSGAADQVKGNVKEAWGNVKESASTLHDDASRRTDAEAGHKAHDTRESITSTAERAKESVGRGLTNLEQKSKH